MENYYASVNPMTGLEYQPPVPPSPMQSIATVTSPTKPSGGGGAGGGGYIPPQPNIQQQQQQPAGGNAGVARGAPETEAVPHHVLSLNKMSSGANIGKVTCPEQVPRPTLQDICQLQSQTYNPPHLSFVKPLNGRVVRATCSAVPANFPLAQKFALPIGFVLQPLAPLEEEVPVVNFGTGENAVVRCKRCRAYINPYVTFMDQGRKWTCNICRNLNDVPQPYYAPIMQNGVRTDAMSRPELCCSTIEIMAPSDYMSRPPQRPSYVFMVEVSKSAYDKGLVQNTVAAIRSTLPTLKQLEGSQVGFITFDHSVQLHNLRNGIVTVLPELVYERAFAFRNLDAENEKVQATIEIDDFVPGRLEDYMVSVDECYDNITRLLDTLTDTQPVSVECAFGPALAVAFKIMEKCGGKLLASLASMPSLGIGRLINREQPLPGNTAPTPQQLMTPSQSQWFKDATLYCSRAQICIDIVLASKGESVDLVTLSQLPRLTGGQLLHYRPDELSTVMVYEVTRMITRPSALEAVLRVRVGTGMTVTNMYGNFYARTHELLALPNCDSDKTLAFVLQHAGNVISTSTYCVQIALLYTTTQRERRIRVHTLNIEVSNSLGRMFNRVDSLAMSNVLARIAVDNAAAGPPQALNAALDRLSISLKNFRTYCCPVKAPPTTLLIPFTLQYVPYWLTGLLHSPAFYPLNSSPIVRYDERAAAWGDIMTSDLTSFASLAAPVLMTASGALMPSSIASLQTTTETLLIEWAHSLLVFTSDKFPTQTDISAVMQLRRGCSAHVWGRTPAVLVPQDWEQSPFKPILLALLSEDDTKDVMGYLNVLFSLARRVSATPEVKKD